MESQTGHILRSDNVKLQGCFHLDIGQNAPSPANAKNATLTPAQVHIVENHPKYAVMEVTCGCGTKTRIRCEYTDAQSTKTGN